MNNLKRLLNFYVDGFKNMSTRGKTLWLIILFKLFVFFFIFKFFFFDDKLSSDFDTDEQRSMHVLENLTK